MELKDKKVIVIGGSSGIGLGVAKAAEAKGASVMVASRSKDKIKKAAIHRDDIAIVVITLHQVDVCECYLFRCSDMFHRNKLVCKVSVGL